MTDVENKLRDIESFMLTPEGRLTRIGLGVGIMATGLLLGGKYKYSLGALGLVPLAAGSFDYCLLGPLLGGTLNGEQMRQALSSDQRPEH